jgi:hypothetical protein
MLIVPLDSSRPLVAMGAAVPQVDRETGAQALPMRVTVPETGLADAIGLGSMVKATGLTLITDVKNGKAWYVYKASALTAVKG